MADDRADRRWPRPTVFAGLAAAGVLGVLAAGLLGSHAAGATPAQSPGATSTTGETTTTTVPTVTTTPTTTTPMGEPSSEERRAKPRTQLRALPPRERSNGTEALRVGLSGPIAPGSPRPTLDPAVAGSWKTIGSAEYFTPASTLAPCASYTLSIPSGTRAREERRLGKRRRISLRVACPSTQALQQALAQLGYLPYTFRSRHGARIAGGPETKRMAARVAARLAFHPPAAAAAADVPEAPPLEYGRVDASTEGALEVYEEDNGLPLGPADERVWRSLLAAETAGRRDSRPYTFVTVSEAEPETLRVHMGNHVVLTSLTNTGVAGAETELGVFPIYARYVSTAMIGTDPDGESYDDPDVPWVNYFNGGDAVHGYERASYGWPQSNGCVELPPATAERVYGMLAIGDIVMVER